MTAMTVVTNHLAQLARLERYAEIAPHDPPVAFQDLIAALIQAGCDLRGPESMDFGADCAENAWIGLIAEVLDCTIAANKAHANLVRTEWEESASLRYVHVSKALGRALDRSKEHHLAVANESGIVITARCAYVMSPWREEISQWLDLDQTRRST